MYGLCRTLYGKLSYFREGHIPVVVLCKEWMAWVGNIQVGQMHVGLGNRDIAIAVCPLGLAWILMCLTMELEAPISYPLEVCVSLIVVALMGPCPNRFERVGYSKNEGPCKKGDK